MFARLLHSVSTFREWMAGAFVFVTSKICLEKGTNFNTPGAETYHGGGAVPPHSSGGISTRNPGFGYSQNHGEMC